MTDIVDALIAAVQVGEREHRRYHGDRIAACPPSREYPVSGHGHEWHGRQQAQLVRWREKYPDRTEDSFIRPRVEAVLARAMSPEYAIVTYYSAEGTPHYYPMESREQAETWVRPWKDRTPWSQYPAERRVGEWVRIPRKDETMQVELETDDDR